MIDLMSYVLGRASGGEGADPDRVEVINTTVDLPFPRSGLFDDVWAALLTGEVSGRMTFEDPNDPDHTFQLLMDAAYRGYPEVFDPEDPCISFSSVEEGSRTLKNNTFGYVEVARGGAYKKFYHSNSTTTAADIPDDTPCVVTLTWHPLPTRGGSV